MSGCQRGEIWLVDLGMVAKTRPVLLLSVPLNDVERAVVTFVPRTTSLRGTRFEGTHAWLSASIRRRRISGLDPI